MQDEYNKIYYCLTGTNGDDEDFTSKTKVIKEAKRQGKTDIMVFRGCEDDQHAYYIGQLDIKGFFKS